MKFDMKFVMKFTAPIICAGVAVALSAAGAFAKPAYVASTVNLRAAPGTSSEVVDKIPGGSLVDAGDCSEGWCAVTWNGKSGFTIQTSLDLSGRVPAQRSARANGPGPGPGPRADGYVPMPGPYADDGYDEPVPYYYGPGPGYYRPYGYYGYRRRW